MVGAPPPHPACGLGEPRGAAGGATGGTDDADHRRGRGRVQWRPAGPPAGGASGARSEADRGHRFEPSAGRGVAYGTWSPSHLLNVPAGRMSVTRTGPSTSSSGRGRASPGSPGPASCPGVSTGTTWRRCSRPPRRRRPRATRSPAFTVGRSPSIAHWERPPPSCGSPTAATWRWTRWSWRWGTWCRPRRCSPSGKASIAAGGTRAIPGTPWRETGDGSVLLLGTGLTAVDVALQLDDMGFTRTIQAISRHGLLPRGHRSGLAPQSSAWSPAASRNTIRTILAELRASTDGAGGLATGRRRPPRPRRRGLAAASRRGAPPLPPPRRARLGGPPAPSGAIGGRASRRAGGAGPASGAGGRRRRVPGGPGGCRCRGAAPRAPGEPDPHRRPGDQLHGTAATAGGGGRSTPRQPLRLRRRAARGPRPRRGRRRGRGGGGRGRSQLADAVGDRPAAAGHRVGDDRGARDTAAGRGTRRPPRRARRAGPRRGRGRRRAAFAVGAARSHRGRRPRDPRAGQPLPRRQRRPGCHRRRSSSGHRPLHLAGRPPRGRRRVGPRHPSAQRLPERRPRARPGNRRTLWPRRRRGRRLQRGADRVARRGPARGRRDAHPRGPHPRPHRAPPRLRAHRGGQRPGRGRLQWGLLAPRGCGAHRPLRGGENARAGPGAMALDPAARGGASRPGGDPADPRLRQLLRLGDGTRRGTVDGRSQPREPSGTAPR